MGFRGTNYHGFQRQPNGITVQEVVETALSQLFNEPVTIQGCSRTDTGVHAKEYCFTMQTEKQLPERNFIRGACGYLPEDISIYRVCRVRPDAHARFDATARTYKYYVTTAKYPFNRQYRCRVFNPLDYERMNEAARTLFEYTDFTSFSKLHTDVKTNICHVTHAEWTQEEDATWVFTIRADRFLRNMVRAIVGTLIEVGRGKLSVEGFRRIIEQKDRGKAGTSVPGNALFLVNVEYPASIFASGES